MAEHHVHRTITRGGHGWCLLLALLLVGALVAAGCSDDDGGSSSADSATDDSTAQQEASIGDLPYADSGWVTLHGDPGNRKLQASATGADEYTSWQALEHTSVLAAPSSGTEGQLFVTTGLPEGESNLHAFGTDGELLWESEPWSGSEGVDPCALLNTPIVDVDGDLYVSDCDQVWAFHPDGEVKWTADLPAAPADSAYADSPLQPNNFITAAFVPTGELVGITIFGQVVVLDRETGEPTGEPFDLPSVPSTRSEDPPLPPGALGNGEVDPQMIDLIWQVAFGGSVVSANTPAVSTDGRLYVVAGGDDPEAGVVYGIDVVDGTPEIAFETSVGVGSGCSPTLSPDEDVAYTCDAAGALYAVATDDGEVLWTVEDAGSEAGSVAVGPEGNVYLLVRNGTYAAYDPEGELLWDADFTTLEDPLPENPAVGPKTLIGGGNPTVIADGDSLVVALNRNYQYSIAGRTPNIPVMAELVELDAHTGEAVRTLAELANPTEGIIHVDPDGRIVSSQGAITTTSLASFSAPIDALLTDGLTVIPPGGGLQVFDPA
jgi:outer membrane protein assembly factor BamB